MYDYLQLFMVIYNYLRLFTIMYDYLQLFTIIYNYLQLSTIIYNYLQLFTNIYNYLQLLTVFLLQTFTIIFQYLQLFTIQLNFGYRDSHISCPLIHLQTYANIQHPEVDLMIRSIHYSTINTDTHRSVRLGYYKILEYRPR